MAGLDESSEDSEELDQTVPFSSSPCLFSNDYREEHGNHGHRKRREERGQCACESRCLEL